MSSRVSLIAAFFALTLAAFAPTLHAATPQAVRTPEAVAISPDGATVAWTLADANGDDLLHLTETDHPDHDRIIGPEHCSVEDPAWSPDGATLAFLAACTAPSDPTVPLPEQVYLWSKSTNESRQLTHLKGELSQIAWSPDGKSIAFLFVENATRSAGALDAMAPQTGVIGRDHIEVQRVYGVDSTTGTGNFITSANLHVYEFDWAPDSNKIAFVAANPPGANNWWVAKLYTRSLMSLGCNCSTDIPTHRPCCKTFDTSPTVVLDPNTTPTALHGLQIAVPRWSPDGKRIAFIGGLMSDQGSTGGDVWVVDAKPNSQPVDITPNIDGTPTWEVWLDNHKVGFVENRRGHMLLTDANADTHTVVPNSSDDLGPVSIGGGAPIKDALSASNTGLIAYIQSSFTHPPEIFVGVPGAAKQFTHLNDAIHSDEKVESVEWTNEGFHVQGWLTFPAGYDPHKSYPLIVMVHGGPSAAFTARWSNSSYAPHWSQLGYFLFEPNPRGSFGEGERFTEANRKDFGYGDLRDILKGMDVLEARYSIDKHREGITGWSYGGYMTMFAITQTHRFAAAVAGAGLSDWLSYYGENSIDQWMIPFFGASVYDDPSVYAKSSPINFVKNVRTPTLMVVGDRDGECPAPQSFEFWHALRDLGVKTELVVYPDEGHGFRDPAHIRDVVRREVAWFAKYMPAN